MSIDKQMDNLIVQYFSKLHGENSSTFYWLHHYWEEGADPRTKGYPLVDISGLGISFIAMTYLFIIFILIPAIMRNRPGLTLRKTMMTYNIIVVSSWVMGQVWLSSRRGCNEVSLQQERKFLYQAESSRKLELNYIP